MAEKKQCFVIAPIGEAESETRKRSDQVLKHIVRPAVDACGYVAERADEIDKPGIITSQVIQRVVADPLVVADLTERNPNVFYELAIRHAIRKPLVQLIQRGDRIPFDVAGTRTIQVDHHDLDNVETAKNEIIAEVKALERDSSKLETPISVSLDLQVLRGSDKPEERSLADMLAAVGELRAGLAKVEAKLSDTWKGTAEEMQRGMSALVARFDEGLDSGSRQRRPRLHPGLLHEMMHFASQTLSRETGILFVASLFRDDLPWLYEAGMDAYRAAKSGDGQLAGEAMAQFRDLAEITTRGPFGREVFARSKDVMILLDELEDFIRQFPDGGETRTRARRRAGTGETPQA